MSVFSATTKGLILRVRIAGNALIRMHLGHLPLPVVRQTENLLPIRSSWIRGCIPQEMFSRFLMVPTSYLAMVVRQPEGTKNISRLNPV